MSIWATFFDLEDNPPYAYQGSHVLPAEDDPRDEEWAVQLAKIPAHITREGRDDQPEDGRPWLRLSIHSEDALLNRAQVAEAHAALGKWLEQTKETS